jgi:alpha/beta superfamily hydrolase
MTAESVLIDAIDGVMLEAELQVPEHRWAAATIAHPHPQYGGDMHNNVVDALYRALPAAGIAALRFNFRGVGGSEGTHDGGDAERLDLAAALELAAQFTGDGPLVAVGYSFGARVTLSVTDVRLSGWCAVAPPLAMASPAPIAAKDHRPKRLLCAEHDQFTAAADAADLVRDWSSTTIVPIPQADHFLRGQTSFVADECVAFIRSLAND